MQDPPADPVPPIAPDTIPGYRIVRELGRGGMATVYLAVQESLGREVALKLLTRRLAEDSDAAERFMREARIAARLVHRHIVGIHDVGAHETGNGRLAYLAMEYLPGGTLATRTLPPREALQVAREIALALDHAHGEGVIHRDIKPENVLRRADGSCALADFGIARATDAGAGVTQEGVTLGTPHYMSPEQLQGKELDGRSDLYSLGVVLYQLLTGEVPYKGTDGWNVGIQHISAPLPHLPPSLSQYQGVIDALMAKDPERRPQTGKDAAHLIDLALGDSVSSETVAMAPHESGAYRQAATSGRHATTSGRHAATSGRQPARRADDIDPVTTPDPWPASRKAILAGAALALVIALGWLGLRNDSGTQAPAPAQAPDVAAAPAPVPTSSRSIAVLPLVNMSGNPANEYFSDGLAETMLDTLARVPDLKVIARTSSFAFKGKSMDVREIGKRLDAANLLEGSVQQAGDRVRVSVQLIRASDGAHLWASKYDRELSDVFAIQDEIAGEVVKALQLALPDSAQKHMSEAGTTNVEAYQEYLRGNALLPGRKVPEMQRARQHFERAIALDPGYARALAAAHLTNLLLIQYATVDDADMAKTRAYLEKALRLAPDVGEVHIIHAGQLEREFKLDEAEREYARGVELSPGYATGFQWYGEFEMFFRFDIQRALVLLQRAYELDPLSPVVRSVRAFVMAAAGQTDEALAEMDSLIAENPSVSRNYDSRSAVRQQKGDMLGALQDLNTSARLDPDAVGFQSHRCHLMIDIGAIPEARACLAGIAGKAENPNTPEIRSVEYRLSLADPQATLKIANAVEGAPPAAHVLAVARTGKIKQALDELRRGRPDLFQPKPAISASTASDAILAAWLLNKTGDRQAARALAAAAGASLHGRPRSAGVNRLGWFDAIARWSVDDLDGAFRALAQGVREGYYLELYDLDNSPEFANLRADPRYEKILAPARARAAATLAKARKLGEL